MLLIQSFVEGILLDIASWGMTDALSICEAEKESEKIQTNLIFTDNINHTRQVNKNSGDSSFYFVATNTTGSQQHIKDILISKKIVGLTKLLTDCEIGVLKELHKTRNTKTAANNLHISVRTFTNHRFNITKSWVCLRLRQRILFLNKLVLRFLR